jgi:formylglycine-generating enzyme required for sulfatase activity
MSTMRAIIVLLLLFATGCPASSDSSGPEPTRALPPPASAEAAGTEAADAIAPDATDRPPAAPAPEPQLAAVAAGSARVVTLPGTAVSFELVPVVLPTRPGSGRLDDGRTLWVARTETTWDAYDVFVYGLDEPAQTDLDGGVADAIVRPSQPYVLADYGFGHAGYPVICVSAAGAEAYCAWLSARTGRRYRLPTEAEWEAVCRGGQHESGDAALVGAWLRDNAERKSHAVATRAADALGLHDVLGNVTEWCSAGDGDHVARGGCWQDRALDVDCDGRKVPSASWNATDPQLPKSRWWLADANFAGFRVVCEDAP